MTPVQRILTLSALGLALASPLAGAVSVSDMRALSTLGEPLRMELELYELGGTRLDDIHIAQAQPADYSRLGLVPPAQSDDISAQLRTDEKGRILAVLQGHQPQNDPNVSLLLQLTWPDGVRLQQVAAVLAPAAMVVPAPAALPATVPAPVPAAMAVPVVPTADAVPALVVTGPESAASATASSTAAAPLAASASGHAEPQVIPVTSADAQPPRPALAPVEVAASAETAIPAPDHQNEVSLTLVNPSATTASARAATQDEGDLEEARKTLLAERETLRARQAALEDEARVQDERLKLLDAQLAALNHPVPASAHKVSLTDAESWSSRQTTGLIGGALLLLGLMVVLLRRSAARTERLAAQAVAPVMVSEYEEFKPRDSLDAFSAPGSPATPVAVHVTAVAAPADAPASLAPVVELLAAQPQDGDVDEPEYDFLTDSEAAAFQTRLDLAMAYLDMNEQSAARELLERILEGGTSEQRRQASALLVSLP